MTIIIVVDDNCKGDFMFNYECFKNGFKKIVKLDPMQSLWYSVKKMKMASTNFALVCEKNTIQGFFTGRRYVSLVNSSSYVSPNLTIKDITLDSIYYARPDQDLSTTIKFMKLNGIKSLPIINEKEFLGILDLDEAIEILVEEREHMIMMLEQYITGSPVNSSKKDICNNSRRNEIEELHKQVIGKNDFQKLFVLKDQVSLAK